MNRKNTSSLTRRVKQLNGFTLMELLIVMSIITVLMLIGFPTYKAVMKHVRELSAKKSLQTIHEAEMMYSQSYPSKGYACKLPYLGGDPSKPPSATAAEMLPEELAKGYKDGYIFTITNCIKNTLNGSDRVDGVYAHGGSRGGGQDRGSGLLLRRWRPAQAGSGRRSQLRPTGPMNGTDSSGAGNPGSSLEGTTPPPPSGGPASSCLRLGSCGGGRFLFPLHHPPASYSLRFPPSAT